MNPERPQIFVLSGPNGAGKTTAASVVPPERLGVDQFVNADLIARGSRQGSLRGATVARGSRGEAPTVVDAQRWTALRRTADESKG